MYYILDIAAVIQYNKSKENEKGETRMKQMTWSIRTEEATHRVTYAFSRLKGKVTVTIDGDSFDLPAGFLGIHPARREIFRLGDEQAVLVVDGKGNASLLFRAAVVEPVGKE